MNTTEFGGGKMKKFFALLLTAVMALTLLAGCGGQNTEPEQDPAKKEDTGVIAKVGLVTDVGTIDDESFNQSCWEGVKEFCEAQGYDYTYYQPTADSNDARVASITQAIADGANVIVLPGYLFGAVLVTVQDMFPDTYFIAVDVGSGDMTLDYKTFYEPSPNVVCIAFSEEQAGYLAGYAAVKDGYTSLGYLGGVAVPAVIRYGYGFVQGCDEAAREMGVDIDINYTYAGGFLADAAITAKMEGWYANGTQIVFAAGGTIYSSACEAAVQHNGMVIGVDVDQHYVGEDTSKYPYNPFVTSAMKGLKASVVSTLEDLMNGSWETHAGKFESKSLHDGDYIGLPTAESSWCFKTFTTAEYEALLSGIKDGSIEISNDTTVQPEVTNSTVNYID